MDTLDNLTNAAAQQNASATQQPVQQLASTSALLLETGTKGQLLDASLYGCPYPELISPAGACVPPPYCNWCALLRTVAMSTCCKQQSSNCASCWP